MTVVLLVTGSVNASILSMGFGSPDVTEIDVPVGYSTIDVNVYVTMGISSPDNISGVSFGTELYDPRFSDTAEYGLTQTNCTTSLLNWSAAGVNAPFGSNQFAVGAHDAVVDSVTGAPGESLLVGVMEVGVYAEGVGSMGFVFSWHTPSNVGSDTGLLQYNESYGNYAGYWAYGAGDPV